MQISSSYIIFYMLLKTQKSFSGITYLVYRFKILHFTRSRVKTHLAIVKEGGVGKYLELREHFGRQNNTYSLLLLTESGSKLTSSRQGFFPQKEN